MRLDLSAMAVGDQPSKFPGLRESEAFLEGRAMAVAMADDWVERVRRECPAESGSGGACESGLRERSCC